MQKWNKSWSDDDLYKKYNLTADEIEYIEKMIRPMTLSEE
jgi:site-specific DNA-methyltransferase (adenine-specific)